MSRFRTKIKEMFGPDFHSSKSSHIRFELASGDRERERLLEAERRCTAIFNSVFGSLDQIWVELTFWDNVNFLDGDQAIALLRGVGLFPSDTHDWIREDVLDVGSEDHVVEHRYSTVISPVSAGVDALLRAAIWHDFGGWEKIALQVIFFDPSRGIIFHPYDDRGADLFASKSESIEPYDHQFKDWILNESLRPP